MLTPISLSALCNLRVIASSLEIMDVSISLEEALVEKATKLAIDRGTNLTGLVREYLERLTADNSASERKRREIEAVERSFQQFQFKMDYANRTWKREDLYERS